MENSRRELDVLLGILRIFEALPCSLLNVWLKRFYGIQLNAATLKELSMQSYISYDHEKDYCSLYRGKSWNIHNAFCFYVIMKMITDKHDTAVKARYPFDFLFVNEDKEYAVIDFSDHGELKMLAFRDMDDCYKNDPYFKPVIIVLSGSEDGFMKRDEAGKFRYVPSCDYILAHLLYRPDDSGNKLLVRFEEKKGGCV